MTPIIRFDEKSYFPFVLYLFSFFLIVAYAFLNPYVGRDYYSYINIINAITSDLYLKEPLFYVSVKSLTFLGLSPDQVIFLFRVVTFYLLMRFFYYRENKVFGIFFFFLIPNIFIGSLNALQTWMAISIFLQPFVLKQDRQPSAKKIFLFAFISAGFHFAGLIYILTGIVYIFMKKVGLFVTMVLSVFGSMVSYGVIIITITTLGYSRYISSESFISGMSLSLSFFICFFIFFFCRKRTSQIEMYSCSISVVFFIVSVLLFLLNIDNKIFLRLLNFLLPFLFVSLEFLFLNFPRRERILVQMIVVLVLGVNFYLTVGELPEDMLNFEQLKRFVESGYYHRVI